MSNTFEVVVGNLGVVTRTDTAAEAMEEFRQYVEYSKGLGRVSNKPVTVFRNGEVFAEYNPDA